MTPTSELARRYAEALFTSLDTPKSRETVLAELRVLNGVFIEDSDIANAFFTPQLTPQQKLSAIRELVSTQNLTSILKNFLQVLAQKQRFFLFPDIVRAYEERIDLENGVIRGNVHSAVALTPEQRGDIESIVNQVSERKVILQYSVDRQLIGGVIAQVGSFRFDDTLSSHLRRMKENLKRSTY